VRCIKPNNEQAAESFDAALVLHQLRCCGVTEIARIARAGYPTRYDHEVRLSASRRAAGKARGGRLRLWRVRRRRWPQT
jgi:hypothetical protein